MHGYDKKILHKKKVNRRTYQINEANAEAFDNGFEQMEKAYQPSQELFYIYSR